MSFGTAIFSFLLKPLQLIFEIIYSLAFRSLNNPGLSIIALSIAINILVLPLYQRADAMQEEERETEAKLSKWVTHIKTNFKGDERTMMLQTYYRQNNYSPLYVLRSAVSLFLQIPFFIAAYRFLSTLSILEGVPFGPIQDLSKPDAMLVLGTVSINALPIIMTALNFLSAAIFTKGYPLKAKIQLYSMAVFFLVFLYDSPAGLVFYWTLNNLFSLVKTVFYKLKNPRFVISVLLALSSFAVGMAGRTIYNHDHHAEGVCVVIAGLCMWLPLIIGSLRKRGKLNYRIPQREPNIKIFIIGALLLAVLTGLLIPSAVIKASPQEFVDLSYFVHPLWYLAHSFITALGMFVFWVGVFYWLTSKNAKTIFEYIIWTACVVAIIDYLFFGTNLGLLTENITFESALKFGRSEMALNALAVVLIAIGGFFAFYKWNTKMSSILSILLVAFVCMSAVNGISIYRSVNSIDISSKREKPNFSLSSTGKNVVVIMLDRAMGEYIPYLFNERPELAERFSGFTYFSNTISFGSFTNFGTPGLYGGYEYTPIEMNTRSNESLEAKHNEALKVMPVAFDEAGYEVTVINPPYAGYEWIPDLSIYDDYPNIRTFNTNGCFTGNNALTSVNHRNRNFFVYGLMKCLPLCFQQVVYNDGQYNMIGDGSHVKQVVYSPHTATGWSKTFIEQYYYLQSMPDMTSVSDDETGAFLMMTSDITHNPTLLDESTYKPVDYVDNLEYDNENEDRFIIDGRELNMKTADQYAHYQVNMATMLLLADWFDYLRENGVYDNTKIILVSDHGYGLRHLEELVLDGVADLEYFYPLLMVKDFNAEGFTVSDDFMTNADVPSIAMADVIESPINPMTGNPVSNEEKYAHDQYVIYSFEYSVNSNNGNAFHPATWFAVHDSIWDKENWELVAENEVLSWNNVPTK